MELSDPCAVIASRDLLLEWGFRSIGVIKSGEANERDECVLQWSSNEREVDAYVFLRWNKKH